MVDPDIVKTTSPNDQGFKAYTEIPKHLLIKVYFRKVLESVEIPQEYKLQNKFSDEKIKLSKLLETQRVKS